MAMGSVAVDDLPAIPIHALSPVHAKSLSAHHDTTLDRDDSNELGRSASYTSVAGLATLTPSIKRTFSENVLTSLAPASEKVSVSMQNANVELFRRASQKTKRRMSSARFVSAAEVEEHEKRGRHLEDKNPDPSRGLSRSVTGTIRNLARRSSWMPTSRTSSSPPPPAEGPKLNKKRSASPVKKYSPFATKTIAVPEQAARGRSPRSSTHNDELPPRVDDTTPAQPALTPTPSSKTLSEMSADIESETSSKRLSRRSSATSLKSRASNDRMYLAVRAKVPPVPKNLSIDRSSDKSLEESKRKDPLWNAFRSIDGEYASFISKTSLQKAKVIRTVLLPFLTKHADHPSNHSLRAEDLDRRIVILNRWWTGLLELLNGRHNQSVSGTDRPAFLEAMTEIMLRAEWRIPPLRSDVNDQTSKRSGNLATDSSDSGSSIENQEADFLLESIHQNIRNIFVQNLLSQLAFVVDKLSMRSAPASLVAFSGKACAYAFFYCPGVADILTRLWHIPAGTLRRIFSESGADDPTQCDGLSREFASRLPVPLRSLAFSSPRVLARHLQHKTHIPPGTSSIRWYGPWVGRWIGRDSDLFFAFTKQYHLMISEFLPRSLPPHERVRIPGMAPIHAQMLVVLESTLYRQAGHFHSENYISSTPGDGPEAMAPLPMVIPNATRSIGENRLIMLLRDIIADSRPAAVHLKEMLVGSFQYVLKAAVRRISMYNNDACFVLCDFLEEMLPIIAHYQRTHDEPEDWSFWLTVFKQLMQSQATMIQIRVISFLYTTWSITTLNDERKREVVLDWLLEPAFFNHYFNHWSPMIRHYFLRLLCWRVVRCNGAPSDIDVQIFRRMKSHLNRCWSHHQYLIAEADMRQTCPPSSVPCSPAPGRMILIVRTDSQPPNTGAFASFDRISPINQSTPYASLSSALKKVPEADSLPTGAKKRWSLLKSINPFSGPTNNRPGEVTPPRSPEELSTTVNANAKKAGRASRPSSRPSSRPVTPPHQALSFKFSLEYVPNRPSPPAKSKALPLPLLPPQAQKVLDELEQLNAAGATDRSSADVDDHSSAGAGATMTGSGVDANAVANANASVTSTVGGITSTGTSRNGNKSFRPELKPLKPSTAESTAARYSGRALAEWNQIVSECRNFHIRRRQEGCPRDDLVETPTMAVETFRMFG